MRNGNLKKLLILSLLSYGVMVFLIHSLLQQISYTYTFENLQDTLRNVKALRTFVSQEQKEEVYRLQKKNIVSDQYFTPELLSSTYCSKAVNGYYNIIRSDENLEPIVLRFASDNPRNLKNKADQFESEILKKFNDKEIKEYKEVKYNDEGKKVLYYALPTKPLDNRCLKCHSTPDKAPRDLVKIYGDKNGFYEKYGTIRALISTEYPLKDADDFVVKSTMLLGGITFLIFVAFIFFYLRFSKEILISNDKLQKLNDSLEKRVKKETHDLETSHSQLHSVIKGSDLGYWDWNLQTGYHEVNDKWLDILGLERADIKNNQSDWEDRILLEDQKKIMPIIKNALDDNHTYTVEFRMRHKDGHYVWIEGAGGIIERDENGKPLRACGTHKDITERKQSEMELIEKNKHLKQAQAELKKLAITDKLTNIFNRHKLDEVIDEEKKRSDRYSHSFGIIILDIDHFKEVNDTYGHHIGDEVLQEFAKVLTSHSRDTDIVGRWGGEEFLIIVPEADKDSLIHFANGLKSTIKLTCFHTVNKLTASIGISLYQNGESVEATVARADDALYISKNRGRDQINFK
jgi:diguanylate cyclase (GGDEF)-like protein/PAS domain S-box-containing protein